jgi:hypothetical protein
VHNTGFGVVVSVGPPSGLTLPVEAIVNHAAVTYIRALRSFTRNGIATDQLLAGLQRGLHQPGFTHLVLSSEERRVINMHRNLERYLDLRMSGGGGISA